MSVKATMENLLAEAEAKGAAIVSKNGATRISPMEPGIFRVTVGKNTNERTAEKLVEQFTKRGAAKVAELEIDSASAKEGRDERSENGRKKNGTNGKGKAKKDKAEVPEGFKMVAGADLKPGDVIIVDRDGKPSAEKIAKIGSGGKSRGREYLKFMLAAPDADLRKKDLDLTRKFTSPRKEYAKKK